jgi:hypothetical protein
MGGLRLKSLPGNRLYKDHRDISKKASHHFKKASIPLKMYLKSLNFSENIFKNNRNLYKSPTFLNRSLNFSENAFKKPCNPYKIFI